MTLAQLNSLSRDEFVRLAGPGLEHSPWIAEATWAKRPSARVEELRRALCQTVADAGGLRCVLLGNHANLAALVQ